jgi:hypothetical protein
MPIPPYLTSFLEVLKTLSFCGLYRGIFSRVKLYFSCHIVVCRSFMCSLFHYVLNVIPFCMQVFFLVFLLQVCFCKKCDLLVFVGAPFLCFVVVC